MHSISVGSQVNQVHPATKLDTAADTAKGDAAIAIAKPNGAIDIGKADADKI